MERWMDGRRYTLGYRQWLQNSRVCQSFLSTDTDPATLQRGLFSCLLFSGQAKQRRHSILVCCQYTILQTTNTVALERGMGLVCLQESHQLLLVPCAPFETNPGSGFRHPTPLPLTQTAAIHPHPSTTTPPTKVDIHP